MGRFRKTLGIGLLAVVMSWLFLGSNNAQAFTIKDFEQWWQKYKDARPEFKPGDVLTYEDREKLRPFLAPEAFDFYIYPGVQIKVSETRDYTFHPLYIEATEKFGQQSKLSPEGELLDYVAGMPFPQARIEKETDPVKQGYMLIWNWEYRWQHQGLWTPFWKGNLIRPGGKIDRVLDGYYQRYYFTHRADLKQFNYTVPGKGSGDFIYKEWTGFMAPFDIKDTSFVVFRYKEYKKEDDGWAYIPALRRVRRISMATRVDSLMGTDYTIDDFWNFSGREADWTFKNLGKKLMLVGLTGNTDTVDTFEGPDKWVPENKKVNWELREQYFLEETPKWERHPYSKKIMTVDAPTMFSPYFAAYDRKGDLWRYSTFMWLWTEDEHKGWEPGNKGWRHLAWSMVGVWDLQNKRASLFWHGDHKPVTNARFDDSTEKAVDKIHTFFDVNRLTVGR